MATQETPTPDAALRGNVFDWKIVRRLVGFTRPYRAQFIGLILITITVAVATIPIPLIIGQMIDKELVPGNFERLLDIFLLLVGIILVQTVLMYLNTYLAGWLGQRIIRDLRVRLFEHLLAHPLRFYDRTPIGRLVTRNVSDIETLSQVFSQGIAQLVAELLQLILITVAMFYISWPMALISLATTPLLLIATYIFKERIKKAFALVRNAVSNLNTFVQEHVTGMNVVQLFNTEKREQSRFSAINADHRRANLKSVKYYSIYFPVVEVIGAIGIGLLVWFGAQGVLSGWVEGPGVIIAFLMLLNLFFRPIRMIADRFNTLQLGVVSTERILKLLDDDLEEKSEGSHAPEHVSGAVEFDNVQFGYEPDEPVLRGISFSVKPGETLALVGATGAGKSSVVNLLGRFYEIQSGDIRLDGVSVREYDRSALRRQLGVVHQDVFLFSDTIRNNLTLGNPDISDEQLWEAARMVGAEKFIQRLPGQLDYEVRERGLSLSVGQRQLISFVRVMVFQPSLIILDEATSSVDTESEEMIQAAIAKVMMGRTALVIAHRLSTIQHADRILVLEKGQIVEEGSHESLLALGGHYARLHALQYQTVA